MKLLAIALIVVGALVSAFGFTRLTGRLITVPRQDGISRRTVFLTMAVGEAAFVAGVLLLVF